MKKSIILLFIMVLILILSACGKQGADVDESQGADLQNNVSQQEDIIDGWSLENGVLRIEKQIENVVPWGEDKDKIESIEISENVLSVPTGSFDKCDNLKEVTLPNTFILNSTEFWYCFSITDVYINQIDDTPFYFVEEAFRDCDGAKIHYQDYTIVDKEGILFPIPFDILKAVDYDISSKEWYDGYFDLIFFKEKGIEYYPIVENISEEIVENIDIDEIDEIEETEEGTDTDTVEDIEDIEYFGIDYSNNYLVKISLIDSLVLEDYKINKHILEHVFAKGVGNFAGYHLVIQYSQNCYDMLSQYSIFENAILYDWILNSIEQEILLFNDFFIEEEVEWQPPIRIDENIGPGGEVLSEEEMSNFNEGVENTDEVEDIVE